MRPAFPWFLVCLALAALALPAVGARAQPQESREATVARIEAYLNGLTTIAADFVQIAPDGGLADGKFFLQRPGKMRWQYNPPVPVLMVSTGNSLIYYDYELEQVSHIPLDETLAGFLAREHIRFDPDVVKLLALENRDGVLRVKIAQSRRPGEGELTMEFTDRPLQLRNLIVKDAEGKETNVSLSNARYGVKLDRELFIFRDPRKGRGPVRR